MIAQLYSYCVAPPAALSTYPLPRPPSGPVLTGVLAAHFASAGHRGRWLEAAHLLVAVAALTTLTSALTHQPPPIHHPGRPTTPLTFAVDLQAYLGHHCMTWEKK